MEGLTNIREIAKEKGLKLSWVAEQSNITRGMIYKIINGLATPHINTKLQIAKVLQVDVTEL